ncbi:hypothetical protein RND81_04G117800 [Saponaria officinalis]|uniref:Uncharacterized protein n=1 Tax=Saponaria officinalis TaxID=3572 RepID=A0AAW1LDQ9_SAPOF
MVKLAQMKRRLLRSWLAFGALESHQSLWIYLRKQSSGSPVDGTFLAVGGQYDYLLRQIREREHGSSPPGAFGASLALETVIQHSCPNFRTIRREDSVSILVCSKGGGGLLKERMELLPRLWEANIKAGFVPSFGPSLTEQYE